LIARRGAAERSVGACSCARWTSTRGIAVDAVDFDVRFVLAVLVGSGPALDVVAQQ
jgi:hypothetical protein